MIFVLVLSGKNNGKGYYIYEKGSKPKPDPSVLPIIEESRRICNIMPNGKVLLFCSVTYRNFLDLLI
jgi:enoyl-CoA hydratase/3-hydroxyacyl-CoA dehydrogenase